MSLFRFLEPRGNSSLRSIKKHAATLDGLATDFREISGSKLPLSMLGCSMPIIEEWFLDRLLVPVVVGNIFHPDRVNANAGNVLAFTDPIELLSIELRRVRTSKGWYQLGEASPLAERTLEAWSVKGAR
ncbi:hypothetical protein [uncultured Agrobacterium sp.]|uniref:hypothetical protein n=1 Tax=uncultured Agrobacterium sp. TaxID=157277 RepID=UPI0025EB3090|nr:hypothetical protein [uncultured Agrobacterium sp.]